MRTLEERIAPIERDRLPGLLGRVRKIEEWLANAKAEEAARRM